MKHPKKEKKIVQNSISKQDRDLNGLSLNINSSKSSQLKEGEKLENKMKESYNENISDFKNNKLPYSDPSHSYVPKRTVKFTPSDLLSYANPNMLKRFGGEESLKDSLLSLKINPHESNHLPENMNQNKESNKEIIPTYNQTQNNFDHLNFKTNFILKFAKNAEQYDRLGLFFDNITENNKKLVVDCYYKLKSLTDKKDRILFDYMTVNNYENDSTTQNWKECTMFFHEFEAFWLKLADVILRELKTAKDNNIQLSKKVNDQYHTITMKENEIEYLNNYISKNDINYKALVKKKRVKDVKEIKTEFEKKEKLNIINVFRLEEE